MKKLTTIEENRSQAKMTFNKGEVIMKFPLSLPSREKERIRTAFFKVFNKHKDSPYPLKISYKPGTPYIFLNKEGKEKKQETLFSYKLSDL